jgi:hypothetical protein
MFIYSAMIFITKAFLVSSRELTNQLNRLKKSTRANSRSSANRYFEKQKMYDQAVFLRVVPDFFIGDARHQYVVCAPRCSRVRQA